MQYITEHWGTLTGELGGIYQQKNLNTVFATLKILAEQGIVSKCTTPKSQEHFRIKNFI